MMNLFLSSILTVYCHNKNGEFCINHCNYSGEKCYEYYRVLYDIDYEEKK